jgi:hypothetical protein
MRLDVLVPWYVYLLVPPLVVGFTVLGWLYRVRWRLALGTLVLGALALLAAAVEGAVTTLPPGSREASLCSALGTEAPCQYHEIGRLRGTLTFAANTDTDSLHTLVLLFTARGQSLAELHFNTAVSEVDILARVGNPATNWDRLIASRDTWPALRALARVTEGVPVLVQAVARKGGQDHVGDPLASTALLKVRVSLVVLE